MGELHDNSPVMASQIRSCSDGKYELPDMAKREISLIRAPELIYQNEQVFHPRNFLSAPKVVCLNNRLSKANL